MRADGADGRVQSGGCGAEAYRKGRCLSEDASSASDEKIGGLRVLSRRALLHGRAASLAEDRWRREGAAEILGRDSLAARQFGLTLKRTSGMGDGIDRGRYL